MDTTDFLAGIYLSAGLAYADHLPVNLTQVNYWAPNVRQVDAPANPYGVLELGWSVDLTKKVDFTVAIRHQSSPRIDLGACGVSCQRGMDTAEVRFTWRPFAH